MVRLLQTMVDIDRVTNGFRTPERFLVQRLLVPDGVVVVLLTLFAIEKRWWRGHSPVEEASLVRVEEGLTQFQFLL